METSIRKTADGKQVVMHTSVKSAVQTNPIANKGEKVARVGGSRVVQKPIRFTLTNTDHTAKKTFYLGVSGIAVVKLGGGSIAAPTDISDFGNLTNLKDDLGDETWYCSGLKLECSDTSQFGEAFEFVQANNGKFQTEDLSQEINLANDGDNYNDEILTIRFADGHMYPFNKRTGFKVVVKAAADALTPKTLYVTLLFGAGENRIMGESI